MDNHLHLLLVADKLVIGHSITSKEVNMLALKTVLNCTQQSLAISILQASNGLSFVSMYSYIKIMKD